MSAPISILVVDDMLQLRELMQTFLERQGYRVETLRDAPEALALVRGEPLRFVLIIADLTLPSMQGNEMALLMLDLNPNLRVLLCSGYPFELDSLPRSSQRKFAFLPKPFQPQELTYAVKELLHRGLEAR